MTTDTPVQALKPCPFCGGPATLCKAPSGQHWVKCTSVGVCFGHVYPNSDNGFVYVSNAVEKWNCRATIPKSDALKTELPQ